MSRLAIYVITFAFVVYAFGAQMVYADYASLQTNDCTLITEFAGETGKEYLINTSIVCSPYNLIGTTTPISVQVYGKCTNGDLHNQRFDVFTYNGVRGSEIGGSKIYQEGENFPLFTCDNINRNVNGVIKMPVGTNESFFVAVSNTSSFAAVIDFFEKGEGALTYALIHFDVKSGETSLSTKAAALAKELINQPYLWGGKGWDYNQNEFVASNIVKTGYNFWNQAIKGIDFGVGVDCSGLVIWAYDRSFDPNKSRFNNFVKAESADEQYRYNTELTTESQLQPGDVMFFDNVPKDNFIDHVAMYVGENGGFDVVSAAGRNEGVITAYSNTLKQLPKFVAFKRVISALPPAVLATTHSPVDLIVTDPDGFTITPTTTFSSELEYLREIPGILYYSEMERGEDGNPIDRIYSYTTKTGDYNIKVIPDSGASPIATYTLDFSVGDQSTTLADNVPIGQIPSEGYGITTSATGVISSFIPVSIDIKLGSYPNSINLKSNGVVPVAIFDSATFDVHQINPITIKLANAPVKLKNNGRLPMINYEDVNGDLFTDIVVHIITKDLQLKPDDTQANLEGKLIDGTIIKGSDSVRIVP